MNLMINYDFFNAIKDVNEGFTFSKIVRNNKNTWVRINFPAILGLNCLSPSKETFKYFPIQVLEFLLLVSFFELAYYKYFGDPYKEKSSERLKLLATMLQKINIETSYDLLIKSTCYHRIYNLKLNNKKIPQILESKYMLVPYYDYKGDVVDAKILQEHVVGSKEYIISIGSPQKVLKPVFSNT